ncbi:hypothetical protein ACQY0O_004605 [Thecaphora frezii]
MRLFHLCLLALLVSVSMVQAVSPERELKRLFKNLVELNENDNVGVINKWKYAKIRKKSEKSLNNLLVIQFRDLPEFVALDIKFKEVEDMIQEIRESFEKEPHEMSTLSGLQKKVDKVMSRLNQLVEKMKPLEKRVENLDGVERKPALFEQEEHRNKLKDMVVNFQQGFQALRKSYQELNSEAIELAQRIKFAMTPKENAEESSSNPRTDFNHNPVMPDYYPNHVPASYSYSAPGYYPGSASGSYGNSMPGYQPEGSGYLGDNGSS